MSDLIFIPAVIVFLVQGYLFVSWWRAWKSKDDKQYMLCFWGFLLGQIYILWEMAWVKLTGKPVAGSPEQNMFMVRFVLGSFFGGLFTIMGLFYLSFSSFGQLKEGNQKEE